MLDKIVARCIVKKETRFLDTCSSIIICIDCYASITGVSGPLITADNTPKYNIVKNIK